MISRTSEHKLTLDLQNMSFHNKYVLMFDHVFEMVLYILAIKTSDQQSESRHQMHNNFIVNIQAPSIYTCKLKVSLYLFVCLSCIHLQFLTGLDHMYTYRLKYLSKAYRPSWNGVNSPIQLITIVAIVEFSVFFLFCYLLPLIGNIPFFFIQFLSTITGNKNSNSL